MSQALWAALGLVFVIEGLLPFLLPALWRRMMLQMTLQSNTTLRRFGFVSMLIGLGWLYLTR